MSNRLCDFDSGTSGGLATEGVFPVLSCVALLTSATNVTAVLYRCLQTALLLLVGALLWLHAEDGFFFKGKELFGGLFHRSEWAWSQGVEADDGPSLTQLVTSTMPTLVRAIF